MELIPFFNLHESRYIIYWPQATTERQKQSTRQIEKKPDEDNELNGITLDRGRMW